MLEILGGCVARIEFDGGTVYIVVLCVCVCVCVHACFRVCVYCCVCLQPNQAHCLHVY